MALTATSPSGEKPLRDKVRLLQWLDRRLGVPLCFGLTMARRVADLFSAPAAPEAPRQILFLKLAEQGSTVLAYEAVRRAVARVGREQVYFFVFEENRFILDLLELIPKENVFTVQTNSAWTMLTSAARALCEMRRLRIDACIDLEFFARSSAALSYLSGARQRIGFHSYFGEGPYRGDLLTHRVLYNPHLHTSATFTTLVEALEIPPAQLPALASLAPASEVPPLFRPAADEVATVRALLHKLGVAPGSRLILLNANAGDLLPLRKWAAPNYVDLAQRLLGTFDDVTIAFTGMPGEAPRIAELVQRIESERCVCVAGRTSLRELLVLYGLAEILITNDSGPAHFAALTPIEVVTLFGPETPDLFAALGPRSHSITARLACSPCVNALNNRQTACRNNLCMQAISVAQVFELVSRLHGERSASAPKLAGRA